jgi:TPR repeat protein
MEHTESVDQNLVDIGYKYIIDNKKTDPMTFKKAEREYICIAQYYQNVKDYDNMIKYCEKAINVSNDVNAMMKLGYYYQAISIDYDKMKKYYDMVVTTNPNHGSVYHNLGLYYEDIEKNIEKAKELYTKGHDVGDIDCAYNLGKLASLHFPYDDMEIAIKYYTIGANAGHKESKSRLKDIEQSRSIQYIRSCEGRYN